MKLIHILLIAIIGISLVVAGCVDDELTSEEIRQQMQEHKNRVQEYNYTMVMTDMVGSETMVVDLAYKHPNMLRVEYIEPADVAGRVQVSNGTYMWIYEPDSNVVRTATIHEDDPTNETLNAQFINELLDMYVIEPNGTETVAGRQCYRITATPKDAFTPISMDVWLDRWNWVPIRIETYQSGELVVRMEYQDIEFNVDLPNSTFEFEIPEGATVESMDETTPKTMTLEGAEAEVTFEIEEPDYLPSGYEMENIMVAPVSTSGDGVVIVYTNTTDENAMNAQITAIQLIESVYDESAEPMASHGGDTETITVGDGYKCTVTTMATPFGETRVLQWNDGERNYMIASSLELEELIGIADSI